MPQTPYTVAQRRSKASIASLQDRWKSALEREVNLSEDPESFLDLATEATNLSTRLLHQLGSSSLDNVLQYGGTAYGLNMVVAEHFREFDLTVSSARFFWAGTSATRVAKGHSAHRASKTDTIAWYDKAFRARNFSAEIAEELIADKLIDIDQKAGFSYSKNCKNRLVVYLMSDDHRYLDQGITVGEQALAFLEDDGSIGMGILFENLGMLHFFAGSYEQAYDYVSRALPVFASPRKTHERVKNLVYRAASASRLAEAGMGGEWGVRAQEDIRVVTELVPNLENPRLVRREMALLESL